MKGKLEGIALILIGVQLTLVALMDPWLPIVGDGARVLIPLLAFIASAVGLILCFGGGKGGGASQAQKKKPEKQGKKSEQNQ